LPARPLCDPDAAKPTTPAANSVHNASLLPVPMIETLSLFLLETQFLFELYR
jgi:hypothetical protein